MTAMRTDGLIASLAGALSPVVPLPPPWKRTVNWCALSIPYVVLVVLAVSPRDDLAAKLADWQFLLEQSAALATALVAATAAFATVIPGHSRRILLLPLPPLALWLGVVGYGCIRDWLRLGLEGLSLAPDWICFPAIVLVGAGPAVVIAAMIRRGAPLMPRATVALAGLAAAGLGNVGLRLFHPQDGSLMVLVWQLGAVLALTAAAACAGRYVLNWQATLAAARGGAA
jgi:hypothetical protein